MTLVTRIPPLSPSRLLARRIARRILPTRSLLWPGVRSLVGLANDNGSLIDRVNGLAVEYSLDSVIGQLVFRHGYFEPGEIDFISNRLTNLRPGAVMCDIGANIGLHSLNYGRLSAVDQVLAFEPARSVFSMLRRNIDRNHLGAKIAAYEFALSDCTGEAKFHFCADDAYSSLVPDNRRPVHQTYTVQMTSLDAWLAANPQPRIDLIKIDVEGNEPAVIRGACTTLDRYRPELVVEIYEGSRPGFSALQLIEAIAEMGYEPFVLVDGAPTPFTRHNDINYNYYFRPC